MNQSKLSNFRNFALDELNLNLSELEATAICAHILIDPEVNNTITKSQATIEYINLVKPKQTELSDFIEIMKITQAQDDKDMALYKNKMQINSFKDTLRMVAKAIQQALPEEENDNPIPPFYFGEEN